MTQAVTEAAGMDNENKQPVYNHCKPGVGSGWVEYYARCNGGQIGVYVVVQVWNLNKLANWLRWFQHIGNVYPGGAANEFWGVKIKDAVTN